MDAIIQKNSNHHFLGKKWISKSKVSQPELSTCDIRNVVAFGKRLELKWEAKLTWICQKEWNESTEYFHIPKQNNYEGNKLW